MFMITRKDDDKKVNQTVNVILESFGEKSEELIPILMRVNRDLGYLPTQALSEISQRLRIPKSQLLSVASFYHMLFMKPTGRHVIKFCESAPCHVVGGKKVWDSLINEVKLQPGETSPDKKWSLVTVSCLGLCAVGPVLMIDEDIHGNITPDQLPSILARYQ
jgi:NADH-quinone oxidoreductase subunit E